MKKNDVLPVELSYYLESVGKKAADFELVGVHASLSASLEPFVGSIPTPDKLLSSFVESIPRDAVAVVDYKENYLVSPAQKRSLDCDTKYTPVYCSAFGTALIPKNK